MSRITGTDAANLIEAYNSLYAPQEEVELTEEQVQEDFENWVNSLVEEGYDLSEYTWEDMYEHYLNEAPIRYSTGPTAADLQRQRAQASTKPAPAQNLRGLSIGPGGFRINNRPVQPGMSPIFQRPGQPAPTRPVAPAASAPARPATTPAAPTRPSAQAPARPVTQTQKPAVTAPAPAATPAATPTRTFNPLMQRTFGYQTGNAPSQIAAASAGKPVPSGSALGVAANPEVRKKLNLPAKNLNQDLDLFDIIKGYLLDEGYADSEEAAFTIMANMSEDWKQSIVEAIDMTKTDAYKNAQTKAATKFYTTPIKPLPPYQARTPRFPALTVPDFSLGTNKPKSPSVRRDDGRIERPVPPRTERPVAPRQKGTESQKPKPQVTPAQPKPEATPYKGPGYKKDTSIQDMIDRSKQRQQAPKAEAPKVEAPRQPISPGAAGAEGVKFVERGSSAAAGSPAKPVRDQMTGLSPRERSQMKR
jgi:hypothetical protein